MRFLSDIKIVEGIAPINTTGAAQTANHISLKGYDGCLVVINTGAWAGGTSAVTLQQATVVAGTDDKALGFSYMYTNDGAATTDTLTKTAVTSNTFNLDTANSMYVIDIKAADFDCIELNTATPGANDDFVSATYILYGGRYADGLTALTD